MQRQDVIIMVIFGVMGSLIPSVIIARHFFDVDVWVLLNLNWGRMIIGIIFTFLATLVCVFNFYFVILAPWFYQKK